MILLNRTSVDVKAFCDALDPAPYSCSYYEKGEGTPFNHILIQFRNHEMQSEEELHTNLSYFKVDQQLFYQTVIRVIYKQTHTRLSPFTILQVEDTQYS